MDQANGTMKDPLLKNEMKRLEGLERDTAAMIGRIQT